MEIAYLYSQVQKVGEKSTMQMSLGDVKETARQVKHLKRKRVEEGRLEMSLEKSAAKEIEDREALQQFMTDEVFISSQLSKDFVVFIYYYIYLFCQDVNDMTSRNNNSGGGGAANNNDPDYVDPSVKCKSTRNTVRFKTVARESLRWETSVRATAAIASAALIDAGIVTAEDVQLVVDRSKIQREREALMKVKKYLFSSYFLVSIEI